MRQVKGNGLRCLIDGGCVAGLVLCVLIQSKLRRSYLRILVGFGCLGNGKRIILYRFGISSGDLQADRCGVGGECKCSFAVCAKIYSS